MIMIHIEEVGNFEPQFGKINLFLFILLYN